MTNEQIRRIRVKKITILARNSKSIFRAKKLFFCSFESKNFFFEFCAKMIFLDQISEILKIKVKFCLTIISIHN
jgi:hypothetical protein